ncbi:hypothetical protein [uncultured Corynebacterium sp.]|uniref:hypothetical protein n=1 Tax=uncultured Corynebacterium sp. TaxID=159447 RepID=UPI0025ECAD73|nr:hypothetical protein [uncultured Corynebacterium sp.]
MASTDRFMVKDGQSYYLAGPALTEAAEKQYRLLAQKNYLLGLDRDDFVAARFHSQDSGDNTRLVQVLGEIIVG